MSGLEVDRERMAKAASDPLLLATDAARRRRQGVPFHDTHEQVAEISNSSFKKPRKGAFRPAPGLNEIHIGLEEARHRFVGNRDCPLEDP